MAEAQRLKFVLAPPNATDPPNSDVFTVDDLIGINEPQIPTELMATPYAYGASGNGVDDDSVAMQAWLDAIAGTAGYGRTGTFAVSSTLYISANTTIYGSGAASFNIVTLPDFPANSQLMINRDFVGTGQKDSSNIALYDIGMSGSSTAETSVEMLAFGGVEGVTLRNCKFSHWRRHLTTYANCNNVVVDSCEFTDWGAVTAVPSPGACEYDGGYALWFGWDDTNIRIIDNYIHDGQWTAILLGGDDPLTTSRDEAATYVTVEGNTIFNVKEACIFGGPKHCTITGNKLSGVRKKDCSANGIEISGNNIVISNNSINNTDHGSIYLTCVSLCTVVGNICNTPNQIFTAGDAGSTAAINIRNVTGFGTFTDRMVIADNTLSDATGNSSWGILFYNDSASAFNNVTVHGNNLAPSSQWFTESVHYIGDCLGTNFMVRNNIGAASADLSTQVIEFSIPSGTSGSFNVLSVGFRSTFIQLQAAFPNASGKVCESVGQQGWTTGWDITSQIVSATRAYFSSSAMSWATDGTDAYGTINAGVGSIQVRDELGNPICVAGITALTDDGFTVTILEGLNIAINVDGAGYAVGDTGFIDAGDGLAAYIVQAVSAGNVTAIAYTSGGEGYVTATGVATVTGGAQPGSGTGLTLDVFSGSPTTEAVLVTAICHA